MISTEAALDLLKKYMPVLGRGTTSEDVIADRDYPPFHRVMMDGIAINFNAYKEGKKEFLITGTCPAGSPAGELKDLSSCLEVMTGAPLPIGASLVIPYEHIEIKNQIATLTEIYDRPEMENVHLMGSDAKKGDLLLATNAELNGPHWGIAKSVGQQVKINHRPRINIISTGDELVDENVEPLPHQIRRSNAYALKASLELYGYTEITLSHLADEVAAIENHYRDAKDRFDLLIYSGGVSKGKFDYLPSTWKNLGVTEHFHGISQRPGKPLWFGVDQKSSTVVLGLPGNPVSSLVCLHKYFLNQKDIYAQLGEEVIFKKKLTYFIPVKLEYTKDGTLKAMPLKIKNSGEFSALAGSDGFLELPKDQDVFKAGEAFLFHPWRPM